MRIGLITGEYPPMQGGIGAYTQILAQGLANLGHTVHVLTSTQGTQASAGFTLHASMSHWGLNSVQAVRHFTRQNQLDILNLQYQTAAFQMSPFIHFLPQLTSTRWVTTFHDLRFPYLFPKAGKLRPWIVNHLAKTSDGVIVTNPEDANELSWRAEKRLIPIGSNILASPAHFSKADFRQKKQLPKDAWLVGYFGFINHSKGVDTLLDALSQAKTETFHPIKLVLMGGETGSSDPTNHAYLQEIQTKIKILNLTDDVIWTGFLEETDVSAWLRACDLITLPFQDGASYRRGSLMAAIHAGSAIITTTPRTPVETFQDQANMVFVPPNDANALKNALLHYLQHPTKRDALQLGAKQLSSQFDWGTIVQQTSDYYQAVLSL